MIYTTTHDNQSDVLHTNHQWSGVSDLGGEYRISIDLLETVDLRRIDAVKSAGFELAGLLENLDILAEDEED